MKLKKIASLALAGIMAVSMLAGCNNGTGSKDDGTTVVPSNNVSKLIAAIDSENVTFTASSSLQATLEKVVQNSGLSIDDWTDTNTTGETVAEAMQKVDAKLPDSLTLPAVKTQDKDNESNDKKEQEMIYAVVSDGQYVGADADYVLKKMAADVVAYVGSGSTKTELDKLAESSMTYPAEGDDPAYWYNFKYTGDIAVVEVSDAVTGQTVYVAAYTITRTPTKVEKK